MASAAPLSDFEEYEHLKKKVIEQKKLPGEVSPADLYKLAVLMSRWAATDRLPMCLLCRQSDKKLKKGHIIPHSVLKTLEKNGERRYRYMDVFRGAEFKGASSCAFFVFCGDCEEIFQQGEGFFNDRFFKPLCGNVGGQHEILVTETRSETSFSWLYFCLISIIWRSLCFHPSIKYNETCIKVLEYLRSYLLDWKNVEIDSRVKLFLFAPNCEVDKKLEAGSEVNKVFFYGWNYFVINFIKIVGNPNFLSGSLFLGPLHVLMLYSEDNFACMEGFEPFEKWKENSLLTPETNEFTIADKEGRVFPVILYDKIIEHGTLGASTFASRLPSADQNYNNLPVVHVAFAHYLPKDISYDRKSDRFTFNTNMFVAKNQRELKMKVVQAEWMANKEQSLFVSVIQDVVNGIDEIAMGLYVNTDGAVEFMKGVNVSSIVWTPNDPPFKNTIEGLLVDLPTVTLTTKPKKEKTNSGDTSYDRNSDRFNTNLLVPKYQVELKMKVVKAERKANKEQILFVVVPGVVNGTGEVAMGLHVNTDGAVEFMKGVNVPKRWNSNDPPFKNTIEGLLRDLPALTRSTEPKEEQSNSDVSK